MARLRKGIAYRNLERPYTRVSKFREKSFIRATPRVNIIKFTMGDPNGKFEYRLDLVSKDSIQVRHNALEASRLTVNRHLEKKLGKKGYHFKLRVYPFHILRENPIAAGAGADRVSKGMKQSFGKPIGSAAQISAGQSIMFVDVNKADIPVAKTALERAIKKLPCKCTIKISEIKA
ncbi:50S ribosomal protein L16 [Candidatus Woesearchaeota archaeon]|nr:50S ribosomal protein L16 [Candidatus Woesearchaeota archaeon]RLE40576.1 MAG: 50S ribosomal protein L16 [Candidatus Woesearchaeota archaeon]